jgi:hypothetical protein
VFDCAAVAPFVTLDGDLSPGRTFDDSLRCEVGGCVLVSRQTDVWDAITAVLTVMTDRHGPAFSRIMRACCRLSCSRPEIDGLDDLLTLNEQAMFDVSLDREVRRDTQGYVTPAEARAFLEAARRNDLRQGATPPGDPIARAHLARNEAAPESESAGASPEPPLHDRVGPMPDGAEAAIAAVVDLLHEAGVMPRAPRALLEAPQSSASRLALIRAHLQVAHDRDPDVYAARSAELAFLSNVIVAGTSIQARPLTREQASTAAVAVCNLGLENWPVHWQAGEDLLIRHDLVSAFQVGWTLLHEDVCMYAAEQLIAVLASLRCGDDDTHAALDELRVSLQRHWRAGNPCESREALDVIAILDMPSWAGLLGLIDELPTIHAAVGALLTGATRQIDPSAFEFISENAQIRQVHAFLALLPDTLRS